MPSRKGKKTPPSKSTSTNTTSTATPPPSNLSTQVLETDAFFRQICELALHRQAICRLAQLTKTTHAHANDTRLMDDLWKKLYCKDWGLRWMKVAEVLFLAANGGGGGEGGATSAGAGEAAAGSSTSTATAASKAAPLSWKALYLQHQKQTLDRPTDFMQNHVSHVWAEDEDWEEGKISYSIESDEDINAYLKPLTPEQMGHIGFNGFVFRYMDYDWKPTGEEAHPGTPAGSDIVMRSRGSALEDEVMAEWEVTLLENPSEAEDFLDDNIDILGVVAPYHGDILLRRHPTEPEVYFSPKGYFTIAEICRIMWFRNQFRPELERWGCVEYMGLCEVNRGGRFVGWRAKIEDTGT